MAWGNAIMHFHAVTAHVGAVRKREFARALRVGQTHSWVLPTRSSFTVHPPSHPTRSGLRTHARGVRGLLSFLALCSSISTLCSLEG